MTTSTPVLLGLFCLALVGCTTTIRPLDARSEAWCDDSIARYAKIRPDALNLDEWTDWHWGQALKMNDRPISEDPRSERISRLEYTNSITHGQPTSAYMAKSIDHGFDRWDHGHKGYISWDDTRVDEAADFHRHDRNHDGWVTKDECSLTILVSYPG